MSALIVHVVAGALFDPAGRVLIAQRPAGKHMAGGWEFPGGKLEPGEDRWLGLQRELREELGIDAIAGRPVIAYDHDYPTRRTHLDLWLISKYLGVPRSMEGQPLQWLPLSALKDAGLLEADWPMIPALQCAVSSHGGSPLA
ncbi:MAG: (deoxy)nucleoside triphosphate pyrophosphohydrolase [Gammaproteobacteria bacterium]|nr:(deoxy)nucleoside triphosphate pyrophosphohydrolase [Gammaproteobacteria bacterium]